MFEYDDFNRSIPREWRTGYVPNCCLFEDGELIKKQPGNGYELMVDNNMAFTPQSEVKGFAEEKTEEQIKETMAALFAANNTAFSPVTDSPHFNIELDGPDGMGVNNLIADAVANATV